MTLSVHKNGQLSTISGVPYRARRGVAHRDSHEVGTVECGVKATIAAEVSRVVTTSSAGDDGIDGQRDRPDGVVSVPVKFTVRPNGCPLHVPSQILFRSL